MNKFALISAIAILISSISPAQVKTTIFLAGDSTVDDKNVETHPQERSWGMMFAGYFDNSVEVVNRARSGRSTKSFIDDGRWDSIIDDMKAGDYVFIQFAHNDEKTKDPNRGTTAQGTFKDNLRKMVGDVRKKGGTPVLLTPLSRRIFDENGLLKESHFSPDDTALYHVAIRQVAEELGTTMLDANARTTALLTELGDEASKALFMIAFNGKDNTHTTFAGGKTISRIITEEVVKNIPELAKHVVYYDIVVSREGRGDYFTIQDAVNAVPDNSSSLTTIRILDGTYNESVVIPEGKNNLHIIGSGADATSIEFDGDSEGTATVEIRSDNVTLSNLCIVRKGTDVVKSSPLISYGRQTRIKNCLELIY